LSAKALGVPGYSQSRLSALKSGRVQSAPGEKERKGLEQTWVSPNHDTAQCFPDQSLVLIRAHPH
jgi:hypothetical protein